MKKVFPVKKDEVAKTCMDDDNTSKKSYAFEYANDENKERGNWSGQLDFLLSSLGYAVGLGNVWRFPYFCFKNGGGVFFIPFFLMLFFVGIPIFLLELSIGQFTSQGVMTCWDYCPIFKGLGYGMLIFQGLLSLYYNIVIAWSIWYLFASFNTVLPWSSCGSWSSAYCKDKLHSVNYTSCTSNSSLVAHMENGTCTLNGTLYGIFNTSLAKANHIESRFPSSDYLNYVSLGVGYSSGIGDVGGLRWDLCLANLAAWLMVFLSLIKGIKSSGKVVYFTALFPYVVLTILLIRGVTLDGCMDGIKFYISPNFAKLGESSVWKDAANQIFFSLSASSGGLIVLSSYNRFKTDIVRDTFIVTIGNSLTSVFAGFVVFSFLGHLAFLNNADVKDVVDSGPGLVFIVYPEAVSKMPAAPFWAVIFFLMLITLGLDSQLVSVECIVTSIIDKFPKLLRPYKTLFILLTCFVMYLISLCMCTNGGIYVLTIFDDYSGGWSLFIMGIAECVSVAWLYGVDRFCNDIELMVGEQVMGCIRWKKFKIYWIACWKYITPCFLTFALLYSWIDYKSSVYNEYVFPVWANAIGWAFTLSVIGCIIYNVASVLYQYRKRGISCRQAYKPTVFWGPHLPEHRKLVTYVPGFLIDPSEHKNDISEMKHVLATP